MDQDTFDKSVLTLMGLGFVTAKLKEQELTPDEYKQAIKVPELADLITIGLTDFGREQAMVMGLDKLPPLV